MATRIKLTDASFYPQRQNVYFSTLAMQPNRRLMKVNVASIQLYGLPEPGSGEEECDNHCPVPDFLKGLGFVPATRGASRRPGQHFGHRPALIDTVMHAEPTRNRVSGRKLSG